MTAELMHDGQSFNEPERRRAFDFVPVQEERRNGPSSWQDFEYQARLADQWGIPLPAYLVAGLVELDIIPDVGVGGEGATTEVLAKNASREMAAVSGRYLDAVKNYPIQEPQQGKDRQTEVAIIPSLTGASTASGWQPGHTYVYASKDPFHALNPELVTATTDLIETTMDQASKLHTTRDPELTYLNASRSRGGKKKTLLTKALTDIDPGMADWIDHLPDAERLRPVAKPWSDIDTVIADKDTLQSGEPTFTEIPQTPAQQVLMGASGDGRAVREREAWERAMMLEAIHEMDLPDGALTITSLGTGTGEPAMDTALDVMNQIHGEGSFTVTVNGVDLNAASLAVASHIAE
jgi:hypothetical protein